MNISKEQKILGGLLSVLVAVGAAIGISKRKGSRALFNRPTKGQVISGGAGGTFSDEEDDAFFAYMQNPIEDNMEDYFDE